MKHLNKFNQFIKLISCKISSLVGSRYFLGLILVLTVAQGLWYALSFQPAMYDEARHFGVTKLYSETGTPFLSEQPKEYDYLGDVTRNESYLFLYVMSWLLSFVSLFTQDTQLQILSLRMVSIAIFICAVLTYRKLFDALKVDKRISNFSLLFFVLTPGVAILPGVYTYDNPSLLFTAFALLSAVLLVKKEGNLFKNLTLFIVIGMLGVLVKSTFIAVYAPLFVFVIIYLLRKHRVGIGQQLTLSAKSLTKYWAISLSILFIVSSALFIERIGVNIVNYRALSPSCTAVMDIGRCKADDISRRNIQNAQNRESMGENFKPIDIYNYFLQLWYPTVIRHHASPVQTLTVMKYLYLTLFTLGLALMLVGIGRKKPDIKWTLVYVACIVYVFAVLWTNYSAYLSQGVPVAMNGRYLFSIIPIFFVLFVQAFLYVLSGISKYSGILMILFLFMMTQGGGLITYLVDHYDNVYVKKSPLYEFNISSREVLNKVIKN